MHGCVLLPLPQVFPTYPISNGVGVHKKMRRGGGQQVYPARSRVEVHKQMRVEKDQQVHPSGGLYLEVIQG